MPSRRRSRRTEPMYWERNCAQYVYARVGNATVWDCENTAVLSEVTLFDAGAQSQFNTSDSRVTVRRIHYPQAIRLEAQTNSGTVPSFFVTWQVVIKTGMAGGALLGVTLDNILSGTFDVLAVRAIPFSNNFSGGTPVSIGTGDSQQPIQELDIRSQRKLTNDERIVMVSGIMANDTVAVPNTHNAIVVGSGIISCLWQRTLR